MFLSVIPKCFYQESILFRIKTFRFPIKDFRHDEKRSSRRESFTSFFPSLDGRALHIFPSPFEGEGRNMWDSPFKGEGRKRKGIIKGFSPL